MNLNEFGRFTAGAKGSTTEDSMMEVHFMKPYDDSVYIVSLFRLDRSFVCYMYVGVWSKQFLTIRNFTINLH